ncbi:MAG: hypothetical protein AAGB93_19940 [Planctomycetota bacterium]
MSLRSPLAAGLLSLAASACSTAPSAFVDPFAGGPEFASVTPTVHSETAAASLAPLPAPPTSSASTPPGASRAASPSAYSAAAASEDDGLSDAERMARSLQNPLANIRALITDKFFGFNTGVDEATSWGVSVQPVYAIDMPERELSFVPRAVIPILGLQPGTDLPNVGQQGGGSDREVGLGDTILQGFVAPYSDSEWKWGVGPQISFPTATDAQLRGPDFGAGIAAVATGSFTDQITGAFIVANHWSFDGNFNTLTLQPMVFYNLKSVPGAVIGYNSPIAADWKASSSNTWTLPLGATVGRTFDMGDGYGIDLSIGPYYNVLRPDGAADWQIRWGVSLLLP